MSTALRQLWSRSSHSASAPGDLGKRIVEKNGEPIHLTLIEFRFLACLIANPDSMLTHCQFLKAVWGPSHVEDNPYDAPSKVIVFAWGNDEDTRRACEGCDDAYRVFRKMLEIGKPPDDWNQLLAEARAEGLRLQRFAAGGGV